jgi:hypothetical protein
VWKWDNHDYSIAMIIFSIFYLREGLFLFLLNYGLKCVLAFFMDLHASTFFFFFFNNDGENHASKHGVFIWWKWKGMFLLTSSVEVSHIFGGVYVTLILRA